MIYRYDDFLARLTHGPIPISESLGERDGEVMCVGCGQTGCAGCSVGGPAFDVTRTVIRLEFAGYQYRNRIKPSPYVREVLSCGHNNETTVGQYRWQRPPKTATCFACSRIKEEYHDRHL
jgi:hypothetical protein